VGCSPKPLTKGLFGALNILNFLFRDTRGWSRRTNWLKKPEPGFSRRIVTSYGYIDECFDVEGTEEADVFYFLIGDSSSSYAVTFALILSLVQDKTYSRVGVVLVMGSGMIAG
jgi:hypothetical protein